MLEHGVEDDQQLAHAGCEGQFIRFASSHQPLVEVPDDGIVATGHQSSHVQDCADPGASAPNGTSASQCATVPVEGSLSHQGGDLPAVQGAQFRQVGQEGERELLSNAGDGAQEVVLLTPYGADGESPAGSCPDRPILAEAMRCVPRCGDVLRR